MCRWMNNYVFKAVHDYKKHIPWYEVIAPPTGKNLLPGTMVFLHSWHLEEYSLE